MFIPQAIANQASRSVLHVFRDEEEFRQHWQDKLKTVDAPGVALHPSKIKAGDIIDLYPTGWNQAAVKECIFIPDENDMPGWHRSGFFRFVTELGYINARVDGRQVIGSPLYLFRNVEPGATL